MLPHPFLAPKILKRASIIALASLSLSVTAVAAAQAPTAGPSAGGGPATTPSAGVSPGGEPASPGDPFLPELRTPRVGTQAHVMRCWVADDQTFSNGNSVIILKNTSNKTIPKGSSIVVVYPDGTTKTVVAPLDMPPGKAIGVQGPPDATDCTASASSAVLPPAVSNGSTGNPSLPKP